MSGRGRVGEEREMDKTVYDAVSKVVKDMHRDYIVPARDYKRL